MESVTGKRPVNGLGEFAIVMSFAAADVWCEVIAAFPIATIQVAAAEAMKSDLRLIEPGRVFRCEVEFHSPFFRFHWTLASISLSLLTIFSILYMPLSSSKGSPPADASFALNPKSSTVTSRDVGSLALIDIIARERRLFRDPAFPNFELAGHLVKAVELKSKNNTRMPLKLWQKGLEHGLVESSENHCLSN